MDSVPWLMVYRLQDLSLRDGLIEFPDGEISGRIRVPMSVFEVKLWNKERDGVESEMMRRDGRSGVSDFGVLRKMKGDGNGGAVGVKLLRSSKKNREGGGNSVSTSSISPPGYLTLNPCTKKS